MWCCKICRVLQTICTPGLEFGVDQSVSLVERCRALMAKQTLCPLQDHHGVHHDQQQHDHYIHLHHRVLLTIFNSIFISMTKSSMAVRPVHPELLVKSNENTSKVGELTWPSTPGSHPPTHPTIIIIITIIIALKTRCQIWCTIELPEIRF